MPTVLRWLLALGPTNPIAVRLIQNASRRTRHLYIRAGYLGVLIVVLLWALVVNTQAGDLDYRQLAQAGASSFTWIAYLQVFLIVAIAPVFMGSAIAHEADERNWDILLTTPLGSAQLVLGHLLGRLFFVLALLVASLPLFAITQYFGGVPGESILASYLIAGCAALVVGAIAIALSASRVAGKRAVFAFYVGVVTYLALTWAGDVLIQQGSGPGVTVLTATNPFLALRSLLSPTAYPRADEPAAWVLRHPVAAWSIGSVALSVVLIALSALTVRTGGVPRVLAGGANIPWYRRLFRLGAAGSEHRPPRSVWTNPIAWREAAARNATLARIAARWAFIGAGGLFGLWLVWLLHSERAGPETFRTALLATVWAELTVVALVAVHMSATAIAREREDGTLDLLLTTPITANAYLTGKLRGLIAYLLPMLGVPLGTMLLAGAYVATDGLGVPDRVRVEAVIGADKHVVPIVLPEAALTLPLVALPFVALCVILGLNWSLKSRGSIGSVVSTFGVVALIAGMTGLCGWKAATDIGVAGPTIAGLSPATTAYASIHPAGAMPTTITQSGLGTARAALAIGSAIAAGAQILAVWAILSAMVRGFDMTVRRLAGMR